MKLDFDISGYAYSHYILNDPTKQDFLRHIHTSYEILAFMEGEAEYCVEYKRYKLSPYDIVLIAPTKYHFLNPLSPKRYERYVLNIDPTPENKELLAKVFSKGEVFHLEPTNSIFSSLKETEELLKTNVDQFFVIKNMLEGILLRMSLINIEAKNYEYDEYSSLITEIINYINLNIQNIDSLEEIAEKFYTSKSNVSHIFQKNLGISPMRYLRDKKLLFAKSLIMEGNRPTKIAEYCGFGSYNTFVRAYEKRFGEKPSQAYIDKK